jgi:thiol-disulfide isomerase/thioredoxin
MSEVASNVVSQVSKGGAKAAAASTSSSGLSKKLTDFWGTKKGKYITISVLVVIVAVLLYYFYFRNSNAGYMGGMPAEQFATGMPLEYYNTEGFYAQTLTGEGNEQTKVLLFYAPWCPHCKSLMDGDQGVWNTLKSNKSNSSLVFEEVNCDENKELANKYNVKDLPTIKLIKGNEVKTYKGDRSLNSIEQFLSGDTRSSNHHA